MPESQKALAMSLFQPNIAPMRESLIKPYCRDWLIICEPLFFSEDLAELSQFSLRSNLQKDINGIRRFCSRFSIVWDHSRAASQFSSGERIILFLGLAVHLLENGLSAVNRKRVLFFDCFHYVSAANRERLIQEIFPSPFSEVVALSSSGTEIMRAQI